MEVKLIVLENGQQLISNIREITDVYGNLKGYEMHKPCLIFMADPSINNPDIEITGTQKSKIDVSLFPWIPLSAEAEVSVKVRSVATLVDPVDTLLSMYESVSGNSVVAQTNSTINN
jgi:hypothetical protein